MKTPIGRYVAAAAVGAAAVALGLGAGMAQAQPGDLHAAMRLPPGSGGSTGSGGGQGHTQFRGAMKPPPGSTDHRTGRSAGSSRR